MDGRTIFLLGGAGAVALVTAVAARTLLKGAPAPTAASAVLAPVAAQPSLNTTEVLVATRALPVGTLLTPDMVKLQPWPNDLVQKAYYQKGTDFKTLQGSVVRVDIPAGQPVYQGALVPPSDRGFLAAVLGPGMRAVTFPVSASTSVGGFIFPGDHVDVILTQSVAGGGDGSPLQAAETVLRNLRVLATDQRADKPTDANGSTTGTSYSMITVEATPKIAEEIAVAQKLGTLSLSLRSLADNASDLDRAIASGDANAVDGGGEASVDKAALARAASRASGGGGTTLTTGADVSRFQRGTVPGKPLAAPTNGVRTSDGTVVRVFRGSSEQTSNPGQGNNAAQGGAPAPASAPAPAGPPPQPGVPPQEVPGRNNP